MELPHEAKLVERMECEELRRSAGKCWSGTNEAWCCWKQGDGLLRPTRPPLSMWSCGPAVAEDIASLGRVPVHVMGDWNHDPLTDPLFVLLAANPRVVAYAFKPLTNRRDSFEDDD